MAGERSREAVGRGGLRGEGWLVGGFAAGCSSALTPALSLAGEGAGLPPSPQPSPSRERGPEPLLLRSVDFLCYSYVVSPWAGRVFPMLHVALHNHPRGTFAFGSLKRTDMTPTFLFPVRSLAEGVGAGVSKSGPARVDTYVQEPIMELCGAAPAPRTFSTLSTLLTASYNLSTRKPRHFFMSFSPIPDVGSLPTRTCAHDAARKFGRSQQKGGCDGSTMPREANYLDRRVSAQAHGPGWALAASFSLKQPESNYERSKGVHETHNLPIL